jgi:DNA-binding CsgD family transcriptional regulator
VIVDRRWEFEAVARPIVALCHTSLPADELRSGVLRELGRLIPADAVWWASADPATLLFTSAYRVGLPADSAPYFVDNEFLADDVNKWTVLARDRAGVRSLGDATAGRYTDSARFRDVFQPLGLEDELRAVLRIQGATWGFLCLHQVAGHAYTAVEAAWLRRLAPHLATGMRLAVLRETVEDVGGAGGPGIVMLAKDGSLVGASSRGEAWLDELRDPSTQHEPIPMAVRAVAARLRSMDGDGELEPRVRVQTRSGRWVVIHAAWMRGAGDAAIAVIIEAAAPTEVAPVIMLAYGLTSQERTVTGLISRGLSTAEVSDELQISAHTVQDHLKSIFGKTGTGSRAELVATLMRQQYLPRARAGGRVGPSGFFT